MSSWQTRLTRFRQRKKPQNINKSNQERKFDFQTFIKTEFSSINSVMFNKNDSTPFYTDLPTRFDHSMSYVDFEQVDETRTTANNRHQSASRLANSSVVPTSDESKNLSTTTDEDVKQTNIQSVPSIHRTRSKKTIDRAQQTSATKMSVVNGKVHSDPQPVSNALVRRNSFTSTIKPSSSEELTSTIIADDDVVPETVPPLKNNKTSERKKQPIQAPKYVNQNPVSSRSLTVKKGKTSSLKWSASMNTPRSFAMVPTINHRAVQGVLVRFFRHGDEHHPGVKIAINESELKSWEAFLNYLNRQPKLLSANGGIKHVYSLDGEEIRSINQFQHRHSYVVSSGSFVLTRYRFISDSFAEDPIDHFYHHDPTPYWNSRSSVHPRWHAPIILPNEQIYVLPYSNLTRYESILLNRNVATTFEEWLNDQVTEVLSYHTNHDVITHLFAVTKYSFIEVKAFSKLFHMSRVTDTYVACTDSEYIHARNYFERIRPSDLYIDFLWTRKTTERSMEPNRPRRALEDANVTLNWIHGYDGENEFSKTLHTLPENELLYVIHCICIIYEPKLKKQRFYLEHQSPISCVNVHRFEPLVASSEIASLINNHRSVIHIWDHQQLRTLNEIRKEQFGSSISLLMFSTRTNDNLLLAVSRDHPHVVLFIDWKHNELIYSVTCKSEKVLSMHFVFDSNEWIACITQQHVLFYHINWMIRPIRLVERRESEVQNIYTGAAACDIHGDRLIVGDKVGSVHVWRLVDHEPKLINVRENILEDDVEIIVAISPELFVLANGQNQIKIWNVKLNTIEQIRVNEIIGSIRSVCCLRQESKTTSLAIATRMNYIICKEMHNDQFYEIMRGQTSPAVGLCCQKDKHYFFSMTSDRYLFKWNNRNRTIEWASKSTHPFSCADIHPKRNIIVLGTETSKLVIYDTLTSFYIATITLKVNTGVKSVRFSPDGSNLAVGLLNGNVFLFDVLGNGDFHLRNDGVLRNDGSSVTHVLWSQDGNYLLSVYNDNDHNIWSLPSLEIVRGKNIQKIDWQQIVHPIMCDILDKSTMNDHTSAIILSPNLVLCCGKDGLLRLFRNSYEHNCRTLHFGLGSIRTIVPSTRKNTYLLSLIEHPVLAEIQIDLRSPIT